MTGRTAFIDGLLADVFLGNHQTYGKWQEICAQRPVSSRHPYRKLNDVTLVSSELWLGTRTGLEAPPH